MMADTGTVKVKLGHKDNQIDKQKKGQTIEKTDRTTDGQTDRQTVG